MVNRAAHVRAVSPDERKPRVLTLAEAIAGGDYLQIFYARAEILLRPFLMRRVRRRLRCTASCVTSRRRLSRWSWRLTVLGLL